MEQTSIRLPLELFVKIIPFLDDRLIGKEEWEFSHSQRVSCDIPVCLFACSLVCHAWNDLCRPLIFRFIRINCYEDIEHSALWTLHFTRPYLCKYIRELRLFFSFETTPPLSDWIDACLGRFVNLRELELQFWSELQAEVRSRLLPGITSMISTTGLKRLALQDWDTGLPSHLQLILFACSTTLEDLMVHFRSRGELPSTAPVAPSTVVRLAALRRLELYEPPASFARTVDIECPNLETFTASYGGASYPWELPSWLPESISELNVKVTVKSGFPQLSWGPIHPSRLTFEFVQYNGDMTRIGEYVDRLPFLDHLRQLTIKSFSNQAQLFFPEPSRYEALYHFLQSLQRPTLSKRIIFIIQIRKQILDIADTELESIRTRELARLEEVFLPLKADGLSIQLVALLFGGNVQRRVLMRCSV